MRKNAALAIMLTVILIFGCQQQSPKRDQIPLLKARIFELQTAVKAKNRAAVDSLLSVSIISKKQGSDSLLSLVYGPQGSFGFERFGNYNIIYTPHRARIECYIMDSTSATDRPLTLYLAREHEMWLFTSFKTGISEEGSAGSGGGD